MSIKPPSILENDFDEIAYGNSRFVIVEIAGHRERLADKRYKNYRLQYIMALVGRMRKKSEDDADGNIH